MKRSKINQVSKRRSKEMRIYKLKRTKVLEENPICQIRSEVCAYHSTCIHHARGRIGANYLNEKEWFASCFRCNQYLETSEGKEWGYRNGFRLDRIGI